MKVAPSALAAILLAAPAARAVYVSDTPQGQMAFTLMADRTIATAWPGVEGRTYFMQWSVDLVHWHYLPMMRHGAGPHTYQLPAQTEPNFHLRLHFDDTATTDPANDDFDYDGITNWDEVTDTLTDPLDSDTDKDGMDDGWERHHDFNPNTQADGSGDPDGDGLVNRLEFLWWTDPALTDSDSDGINDGDEVAASTNPRSDLPEMPRWLDTSRWLDYQYQSLLWEPGSGSLTGASDWNNHWFGDDLEAPIPFTELDDVLADLAFPGELPFPFPRRSQANMHAGGASTYEFIFGAAGDGANLTHRRLWLRLPYRSERGIRAEGLAWHRWRYEGYILESSLDPHTFTIPADSSSSAPLDLVPGFRTDFRPDPPPSGGGYGVVPAFEAFEDITQRFIPLDLAVCERGSVQRPGHRIPRPASGRYQTVTIENGDLDQYDAEQGGPNRMVQADTTNAAHQDAAKNAARGSLSPAVQELDDDLCKIFIDHALPADWHIALSLALAGHEPGPLDPGVIRIYDCAGQAHPAASLAIPKTRISEIPPGPVRDLLSQSRGLYLEIGDLGTTTAAGETAARADHDANRTLRLELTMTIYYPGPENTEASLEVTREAFLKRGGLWIYDRRYDNGFSLHDGIGNTATGAAITNPAAAQVIDGRRIAGPWDVKNGQRGHTNERTEGNGPSPDGWYFLSERTGWANRNNATDFRWTGSYWRDNLNPQLQLDQTRFPFPLTSEDASPRTVHPDRYLQGRMSVWRDDVGTDHPGARGLRTFQGQVPPQSVHFKFDMLPDFNNGSNRSALQVHPDGRPRGTQGCVGVQEYHNAVRVQYLMRHLRGVGIHVRNAITNSWNTARETPAIQD